MVKEVDFTQFEGVLSHGGHKKCIICNLYIKDQCKLTQTPYYSLHVLMYNYLNIY